MKVPMGPPPPRNPNPNPNPAPEPPIADQTLGDDTQTSAQDGARAEETSAPAADSVPEEPEKPTGSPDDNPESNSSGSQPGKLAVPYSIPPWSEPPGYPFFLEVLKDGTIIEQFDVSSKGAYMFGRVDLCDFVLEHPTISRFHAVLQFKKDGEAFLYDLGSTHGTFINKMQVKKNIYKAVHVGDVIRFGLSTRLYIFQGPSELMPAEGDLDKIRSAKIQEEMLDREASLLRARVEASLADGISWGMAEDAIEEAAENGSDEVTWQTYKGQLTERQEKTRGKIIKRLEKVTNMRKEIDAIRAKDIAQGGLTQGQQTQIARNEQRISQIMEELESLEETLNESIQESIGARAGKIVRDRKKGNVEDEDDKLSDDDEFYDRTKKKPSARKSGEEKSVETADTLLDKKEAIINEMEKMKELLAKEREKLEPNNENNTEAADDLDTYMSGLSSQLVRDKVIQMQKELSDLQTELDKIMYLLRIADPMGEAARKRDVKAQVPESKPSTNILKQPSSAQKQVIVPKKPSTGSQPEETSHSTQAVQHAEEGKDACKEESNGAPAFASMKPQWLGAKRDMEPEENKIVEAPLDESDNFIDYKDRKKALASVDDGQEIERAAPGLIIRKRKPIDEPGVTVDKAPKVDGLPSSDTSAADAVALLLKHKRGYFAIDDGHQNHQSESEGQAGKEVSQPKRVLGPSRPTFLDSSPDYESWMPPEGQTGDGRTSLNDRLGY
ncbi:kanadaptin [Phoenix dactylifera]|uniref:Kanadaptin n=1 Tax=Phoenix dactylifera TaxID=42345 RepID=A0A8B9ANX2_PHODC|nr:kanadaptin [Phoenix dactylifera]XP_038988097.1 kanadaptin [Phoenix dactylifera]